MDTFRRVSMVAGVLLAASQCGCRGAPNGVLRVCTLNIGHGRGQAVSQIGLDRGQIERNLRAVGGALAHERPDVVALQETDACSAWSGALDHVELLAEVVGTAYYRLGLHVDVDVPGVGLHYGTALMAWQPLVNWQSRAFKSEPLDTKGYVAAEIGLGNRKLQVVSVHLDSKTAFTRKKQAHKLVDELSQSDLPLIVMGDMNCVWSAEQDALRLIAGELGLKAWRPECDDLSTYPVSSPRRRIDWILVSRELEFRDYRCLLDKVSDHVGVVADLAWK